MRYSSIFFLGYVLSNTMLHAEEKRLGSILQEAGVEKKVLNKSAHTNQNSSRSKESRFIFKDEYQSNTLEGKGKTVLAPQESKSYTYENKSRFQFKFNDGAQSNNFVAGQRSPDSVVPIGGGFIGGAPIGGTPIGGGQGGQGGGGGRR